MVSKVQVQMAQNAANEVAAAYLKERGWTFRGDTPGQKHKWEKPDGSWSSDWLDAFYFEASWDKEN